MQKYTLQQQCLHLLWNTAEIAVDFRFKEPTLRSELSKQVQVDWIKCGLLFAAQTLQKPSYCRSTALFSHFFIPRRLNLISNHFQMVASRSFSAGKKTTYRHWRRWGWGEANTSKVELRRERASYIQSTWEGRTMMLSILLRNNKQFQQEVDDLGNTGRILCFNNLGSIRAKKVMT